ncbi:hypothetical protein D3C87_761170 [compost metagenome]
MAEHVGEVADGLRLAEPRHEAAAHQEVPDERFTAHQELVGQDVPGADSQAPLADEPFEDFAALGLDRQVIGEHDGLAIEEEVRNPILFQELDDAVDGFDQLQAELLIRTVPLPIPMGMGDDDDFLCGQSDPSFPNAPQRTGFLLP